MTLEYLPDFLGELAEMQALATAQDGALEEAMTTVRTAPELLFLETLPLEGVTRWETMLRLPSGQGNDLDQRRFRLMTYVVPQTPFTMTRLKTLLTSLCGADCYSLDLDVDAMTLEVRVALETKGNFPAVEALVERVVPANIFLDMSLQYNTHGFLSLATHQQLGYFTHKNLKEEVRDSWQVTQEL